MSEKLGDTFIGRGLSHGPGVLRLQAELLADVPELLVAANAATVVTT